MHTSRLAAILCRMGPMLARILTRQSYSRSRATEQASSAPFFYPQLPLCIPTSRAVVLLPGLVTSANMEAFLAGFFRAPPRCGPAARAAPPIPGLPVFHGRRRRRPSSSVVCMAVRNFLLPSCTISSPFPGQFLKTEWCCRLVAQYSRILLGLVPPSLNFVHAEHCVVWAVKFQPFSLELDSLFLS